MADPEHIKWLLEGRRSWNRRRREQDFIPDLSGEDIAARFLDAKIVSQEGIADLTGIDLSKALLSGCNFSGSLLRGANFSKADLGFTCFNNAQLSFADLTAARLDEANLSGADLTGAELGQAYLQGCNLKETKLGDAHLVGSNLTGSRFWLASMRSVFPGQWESYPHASLDGKVPTINDLLERIKVLEAHYSSDEELKPPVFYYRGESRDDWHLTPNVMRPCKNDRDSLRDVEAELLVELRSRRAVDFESANSALDQMVIAQHHGLPTRLLDVTRNPLVALFHATQKLNECPKADGRIHLFAVPRSLVKPFNSDTVSVITNFASLRRSEQNLLLGKTEEETKGDIGPSYGEEWQPGFSYTLAMNRLYQFIRLEKPSFQERINPKDLFKVFIVEPQQWFERIRSQSGAFLISALHERFEENKIRAWSDDLTVYHHYTLEVPCRYKGELGKDLTTFNVTNETMLPGMDQSAKSVSEQYWKAKFKMRQSSSEAEKTAG